MIYSKAIGSKNILYESYYNYYTQLKSYAIDNVQQSVQQPSNYQIYSSSFTKTLNPDGTYTINENKQTNINGEIKKSKDSYIIDKSRIKLIK